MVLGWIRADIGDPLVQREENPAVVTDSAKDDGVRCSRESFVPDRVGLMAGGAQVVEQLGGKVLVQLDFHAGRSGRRLSSRASSAA